MFSAFLWILLMFALIVAAKMVHARVINDERVRAWYEQKIKHRLNLIKTIGAIATVILWAGIWLVTRGDDKDSVGKIFQDFSNSWQKQDSQTPPVVEKE